MYDYSKISTEGIKNALRNNDFLVSRAWSRERCIQEAEMLMAQNRFDEIELIIEESGE